MSNKPYTYQRVDDKIILTMVIVALLGFIASAYRYSNYTPCGSFSIKSKAWHYTTGEAIRFESNIRNFERLHWNFGDNQGDDTKLASVVHAYDEPGEYLLSLSTDGGCTEYKTIVITPAQKTENPTLLPTFICASSAEVGKQVTFRDTTSGAVSWEWRFGESATVDATSQNASYTYQTPGLKTVSIIINNDQRQMGVCKIYVNPPVRTVPKKKLRGNAPRNNRRIPGIPEKPTSDPIAEQLAQQEKEEPKAPPISGQQFDKLLRGVANKQKTAVDFSDYLCGNLNIQVSLNGQETSFSELCTKLSKLKSEKKIKRLNVQLIKNEKTSCVIALVVLFKEKETLFTKLF